jgi:hypothetical protein
MIHNLTIGHLDIGAIDQRRAVVLRPLDELAVSRHLKALGRHVQGGWTLDGMPAERLDGYVVCRWLVGPRRNLVAEEFALRLSRETGCVIADREHCRNVPPADLQGLSVETAHRPFFSGVRRFVRESFGIGSRD